MRKITISILVLVSLFSTDVFAVYFANQKVIRIRIDAGSTYVATTTLPSDACDNYSEYFKFNHKTEEGKAYLSALLAAKTSQTVIDLWYLPSTSPGTTAATGCTGNTMAVLTGIRLK